MGVKRNILFISVIVLLLFVVYSGVSEILLISEIQVEDANKEIFNNVNYVMDITNVSKSEFKSIYADISNSLSGVINEEDIGATYNENRFTSVFSSSVDNIEDVKSIVNSNIKSGYFNVNNGGRTSEEGGVIYKLTVSYKQNIIAKLFDAVTPRFMIITVLVVIGIVICFPSIVDLYECVF